MIRIATEADIPAILSIYGPYVLTSTATFEYTVPTQEEFLARFRTVTRQHPWLVWEENGKVLGYTYASAPFSRAAYSWCAEPSIYLHPDAIGKGIGKKLYSALERILLAQGYQVLYAHITSENRDSVAFHQRFGYTTSMTLDNCGFKFGRWLGLIWMEKRLTSVEIPSCFPTPWPSIMQNAEKLDDILGSLSLS